MKYLIFEGTVSGEAGDLELNSLPTGGWLIVESDLHLPPSEVIWDGSEIVEKPKKEPVAFQSYYVEPDAIEITSVVEQDIYDFDTAIVEAETNPLVLVALVKALYAKMRGDTGLVEQIAEDFQVYKQWKASEETKEIRE